MPGEKTISFRADASRIEVLDALAAAHDRSRSYLINEAIGNYIKLHSYHDELVRKGLEQMRQGHLITQDEVKKRIAQKYRTRRSLNSRSSNK